MSSSSSRVRALHLKREDSVEVGPGFKKFFPLLFPEEKSFAPSVSPGIGSGCETGRKLSPVLIALLFIYTKEKKIQIEAIFRDEE